ncbi:MAG: hypothetical protein J2P41_04450 [Blastocatellia bacterium]|nr:hypothetical protein [Blastocatellia bacterium]
MNEDLIRNIVREVVRQVLTETGPAYYLAPWTGAEYEAHPSRSQFNIDEATSPLGNLQELGETRACSIEKDKPCDHCGICRSLGF